MVILRSQNKITDLFIWSYGTTIPWALRPCETPPNIRDAPFDIWGGGGLEFLLLANFFFTSGGKLFFWRSTSDNFFFMFRRRNFLSYAFPIMYVTIWCFFWSTYFSSISTTNFFFLPTFSTNFFF